MIPNTLGAVICRYRMDPLVSQQRLADRIGIPACHTDVSRLEHGNAVVPHRRKLEEDSVARSARVGPMRCDVALPTDDEGDEVDRHDDEDPERDADEAVRKELRELRDELQLAADRLAEIESRMRTQR